MIDQFECWNYFASQVYITENPEYFNTLKTVSDEYYQQHIQEYGIDEVYPVVETMNFNTDERVSDFVSFIAQSSWEILSEQGYNMEGLQTTVGNLWLHVHHKYSSMDIHTHGYGSQLSGFYFLDCPEKSPVLSIHDPRPAKLQVELEQIWDAPINTATKSIWFEPKPGSLYIVNSWLPHSFSRNPSEEPFKFVHFNVFVSSVENNDPQPIII